MPVIYVLLCTCRPGPSYRVHHLPVDTEMLQRQRDPPVDPATPDTHLEQQRTARRGLEEEVDETLPFHFFLLSLLFTLPFKGDSSTLCLPLAVSLPLCLGAVHLAVNFETLARSPRNHFTGADSKALQSFLSPLVLY